MPAKFRRFVTRTALQANCLCGQTFGVLGHIKCACLLFLIPTMWYT